MAKEPKAKKTPELDTTPFEMFVDKSVRIKFGTHDFTTIYRSAELQVIGKLVNTPRKRAREDGKGYTPRMMRLNFDSGALVFVLEDIQIVGIAGGISIDLGTYAVSITLCT